MNKGRLMAAGSLLAIGAMFPVTAGALSGAEASPASAVSVAVPTTTPAPATVPAPAQTPPRCYEDEPCWDCLTMGNKLCGVDPANLEDAWASFDAEAVAEVVGKSVSFGAVYVGTSGASSMAGYWVVPSLQYPNTFHVFMIEPGE